MKILDLDMDYFMEKIANGIPEDETERLPEDYDWGVWTENRVVDFLENNLGLSKNKKIKGRIVKHHNQALFFWEELADCGSLSYPFEVVHVDSHADMDVDLKVSDFLQDAFFTFSVETRRMIRSFEEDNKEIGIGISDYLVWAIAYQMISKLTYCANPNGDKNDYSWRILKDFHEEIIWKEPVTNFIQLKYNEKMPIPKFNSDEFDKTQYLKGAMFDPEVEFKIIPTIEHVKYDGDFDFAVMAQSPNFTPASADFIIEIFREYIDEI